MRKYRIKTYAEAINEALHESLKKDKNLICYGMGVGDPKEVFNTTKNLQNTFSKNRVFDIPASENALTGIAIGCAIKNCRVVLTHQRADFALLSMDQIINNASKFHYIFNGKIKVPITIRLIVGRGWGQGATHSQSLQSIFSHFPGLKVVMPSSPDDAKKLLISSIFDPNPVIFLEHRWLHDQRGMVEIGFKKKDLGKANLINKGKDLTIISVSYMTSEAKLATRILEQNNIGVDLIDLASIKPLDTKTIIKSIKKTGRLIIVDTGFNFLSIASEIISIISTTSIKYFKFEPIKLTMPDIPVPSSFNLTKKIYPTYIDIIKKSEIVLKKKIKFKKIKKDKHDVPNNFFTGPF
jgi:pyruvate dehydrogenase E1 component beta subunit